MKGAPVSEHLVRSADARATIARLFAQLCARDLNDRRELVASFLATVPRSNPAREFAVAVMFEKQLQVMGSSGATTFERGEIVSSVDWLSELLQADSPSMRWMNAADVRALEAAIPADLREH